MLLIPDADDTCAASHLSGIPIGSLVERRKDLRGMAPLEVGMRWATVSYGKKVINIKKIFVIPQKVKVSDDGRLSKVAH